MKNDIKKIFTFSRILRLLAVTSLSVAVSFESMFLNLLLTNQPKALGVDINALASLMVEKCAKVSYRPACYDDNIPKLMDNITMNQAFEVTAKVQELDPAYAYCHVLGHKLSAREVDKDMSRWWDVIAECPNGLCANGCLHGAFQERFRAETLDDSQVQAVLPEVEKACEARDDWHPTGLEQATCYHGIGHISMQMTNADFIKALKICDTVALKSDGRDFRQLCYEGLFMQLFQPLEPEDFALVKGKVPAKEDLQKFCNQWGSTQKVQACWSEGWPLYRAEIKTPKGLVAYCDMPKDKVSQNRCFYMLFHTVGQGANFDEQKINQFCSSAEMPKDLKGLCFSATASSVIQADKRFVDKAVQICGDAQAVGVGKDCFSSLAEFASYNLKQGEPEFDHLCASVPQQYRGGSCVQTQTQ